MKWSIAKLGLGGLCLLAYRHSKHMALWTLEDPQESKPHYRDANIMLDAAVVFISTTVVEVLLGGSRR